MFDAFRRSWELAKASLAVLGRTSNCSSSPFISFLAEGDAGPNFRADTMSNAFRTKDGGATGFGQPR